MFAERSWNVYQGFRFEAEQRPEGPPICEPALYFGQWADKLCQTVEAEASQEALSHAKVLLLDKYFEWWIRVPKHHRNRIGSHGHICIFQVFEQAYQRILGVQLNLVPLITVQATPVSPAPTKSPTPTEGVNVGVILDE